ncbi:2-oxoisovalerate dehydrogenase E2 component (dihydrolipoyl transacylase) [Rhodococcus sp. SORGH_AS303]|nr:2-oxoisovalerate dehydrogenase E2 component (dihydrolipoyl transacylase) [Rhodococcus sp. SORGH_AS_0303]
MSTVKTFLLPDLGEGLADAELLTWSVDVGDTITLNQTIAEVETAKASVELPSPYAGVVVARHAEEGTTIDVGAPFLDIEVAGPATTGPASPDTADEAAADARPEPSVEKAESETVEAAPTRTPVLVGYGVAEETSSRRPLAAPPVRKEARERGIDLATVAPTGPHGNVTRDDLAVSSAPHADEERTPIKGVRKHTAEAMVRSAFTAPHVTEFVTVDVTPMMELLDELKASPLLAGVRVTPLALVAKALLIAVREHPSLNSSWDEAANEIVTKKYVNLGIAAATPRGLMVPNIKNAQTLGFRDLCSSLSALTAVAKEGKDRSGGTRRRDHHDHQHRRVRHRFGHTDPHARRSRHPVLRGRPASAVGVPRGDRAAARHDPQSVVRSPARRRRTGLDISVHRRDPALGSGGVRGPGIVVR